METTPRERTGVDIHPFNVGMMPSLLLVLKSNRGHDGTDGDEMFIHYQLSISITCSSCYIGVLHFYWIDVVISFNIIE